MSSSSFPIYDSLVSNYNADISKINALIREVEEDECDRKVVSLTHSRLMGISEPHTMLNGRNSSAVYIPELNPLRLTVLKSAVALLKEGKGEEAAQVLQGIATLIDPWFILKRVLRISNSKETIDWAKGHVMASSDTAFKIAVCKRIVETTPCQWDVYQFLIDSTENFEEKQGWLLKAHSDAIKAQNEGMIAVICENPRSLGTVEE